MGSQRILLAMCLFLVIPPTQADRFAPSHFCSKPYKPYRFTTEWEVNSFNNQVETYKNCIEDFVTEQNTAAKKHQDAAEEAIEEWNRFVKFELK